MAQTLATLAARYNQFAPDPELHGSYYPTDVYPGESISATIRSSDDNGVLAENLRVWRLSPLGLEILVDGAPLRVGQLINLDLKIGAVSANLSGPGSRQNEESTRSLHSGRAPGRSTRSGLRWR